MGVNKSRVQWLINFNRKKIETRDWCVNNSAIKKKSKIKQPNLFRRHSMTLNITSGKQAGCGCNSREAIIKFAGKQSPKTCDKRQGQNRLWSKLC